MKSTASLFFLIIFMAILFVGRSRLPEKLTADTIAMKPGTGLFAVTATRLTLMVSPVTYDDYFVYKTASINIGGEKVFFVADPISGKWYVKP